MGSAALIENVTVANTPGAGIFGTSPSPGARFVVRNCRILAPGATSSTDGYGIELSSVTDSEITGNYISTPRNAGIFAFSRTTDRAQITGNTILNGLDNGIRWGGNYTRVVGNYVEGCLVDCYRADGNYSLVEGNTAISCVGSGFKTDGTTGGTWSNNIARSNGNNGFYLSNAVGDVSQLRLAKNTSDANTGAGIRVNPGKRTFRDISISDNSLTNNSWEGIEVNPASFPSNLQLDNNYTSENTLGACSLSATGWTYSTPSLPSLSPSYFNCVVPESPSQPVGAS